MDKTHGFADRLLRPLHVATAQLGEAADVGGSIRHHLAHHRVAFGLGWLVVSLFAFALRLRFNDEERTDGDVDGLNDDTLAHSHRICANEVIDPWEDGRDGLEDLAQQSTQNAVGRSRELDKLAKKSVQLAICQRCFHEGVKDLRQMVLDNGKGRCDQLLRIELMWLTSVDHTTKHCHVTYLLR